jgi:hypothetical protein
MALGYNAKLVLNVEAVDNLVSRALHYRRFAALSASKIWGGVLAAKQPNTAAPTETIERIMDPAGVSAVRISDNALLAHIAGEYASLETLLTSEGIAFPRIVEGPPPPPPTPASNPAPAAPSAAPAAVRPDAAGPAPAASGLQSAAASEESAEHWSSTSGFRNGWSLLNLIDAHTDTDLWDKPLAVSAHNLPSFRNQSVILRIQAPTQLYSLTYIHLYSLTYIHL